MAMTARVQRRIERDFPQPGSAAEIIRLVGGASDDERVQAAIVLAASGQLDDLRDALALAQIDWRDLLVNVGLATEHWSEQLDSLLGHTST